VRDDCARRRHMLAETLVTLTNWTGTYIIPLDGALDCVNNFPTASQPVNAYNAATWTFQAQDFHPANSGYFQISDAYWGFLLANP